MRLLLGFGLVLIGVSWLFWMAGRDRRRVPLKQAIVDFITGASRESVLSIGLFLFGLLLIAAYFTNSN